MNILASSIWSNPAMILLLLIICFAVIALVVFLIRYFLNKNNKEEKPTETQIVEEDLDRYLQPVDDEETKKAFDEYEKDNKEEDK